MINAIRYGRTYGPTLVIELIILCLLAFRDADIVITFSMQLKCNNNKDDNVSKCKAQNYKFVNCITFFLDAGRVLWTTFHF